MSFQPGAMVYTQGFGSRPESVEVPHVDTRSPTTADTGNGFFGIGKRWINTTANAEYTLTSLSSSVLGTTANWTSLGTAGGVLNTLTDGSGSTVTPVTNNIQIAGTGNQIASTAGSGVITLSLIGPYTPTTYTAHGVLLGEGTSSISATAAGATGQVLVGNTGTDPTWTGSPSFSGSVTAATGLTVTSGGLTVSAGGESITGTTTINTTGTASTTIGNVSSTLTINAPSTFSLASGAGTAIAVNTSAGTGIPMTLTSSGATVDDLQLSGGGIKTAPVIVAAGASPQTANGRFIQVTFSGVSIAAGATQTFVISNSVVTGASTVIDLKWYGATTASALSIGSITPSAGSISIVMTNGTGATTSTANITFNVWVMN